MQVVSATRFKQLNRNRNVTGTALAVRKQMLAPVEQVAGDMRALRFTISTGTVDRELDSIALQGWDLTAFKRNAVVLWQHNSDRLPIGRAQNVQIEGNALKATVEFIPADTPEGGQFAESVYRLCRGGFLQATSVGFRPLKWEYSKDPARDNGGWFPGIDFEQQELVELSVVTVPANPEALMEPQQMPAPAMPAEVASDTPPQSGEELTALDAAQIAAKQEQARAWQRRRHVARLAQITLEISNASASALQ